MPTVLTEPKLVLKGHSYWVRSVCWSPDGELIATACADKSLRVFNATGREMYKVAHPDWVWCVAFSYTAKKQRLATSCLDGRVRLLEASTGREIIQMKDHSNTVNSIAFSGDGSLVLSGSYDKTAKLFTVADGKVKVTLGGHTCPVLSVAFVGSSRAAVGSASGELRVSDLAGRTLHSCQAHAGPVLSISVSGEGELLATAGTDKLARVWRVREDASVESEATCKHASEVNCVLFSPDGLLFATAAADGHVRVYEAGREWEELARLKRHSDEANALSFNAKGSRVLLASASDDRSAAVWDISGTAVALRVAKARAKTPGGNAPKKTEESEVSVGDQADMEGLD
mmetsp:Transcript_17203/g.35182  ORF Transcript_17203/g.35182 Transcript_17203/m.35182 type:complete len:343 (-) Transcript_17203:95-1123(-)